MKDLWTTCFLIRFCFFWLCVPHNNDNCKIWIWANGTTVCGCGWLCVCARMNERKNESKFRRKIKMSVWAIKIRLASWEFSIWTIWATVRRKKWVSFSNLLCVQRGKTNTRSHAHTHTSVSIFLSYSSHFSRSGFRFFLYFSNARAFMVEK